MTKQQIEIKINELEQSLIYNPNNPERSTIEADLRDLKEKIANHEIL